MKKTWIKVKRGLLQPEHRDKIGIRIWLYLFMVDQADWDTGIIYDWKDQNAADELGMPIKTLRQQRQELESTRYIDCLQCGNHQKITILKWIDPRSYSGEVLNNGDYLETKGTNESTHESTYKGTQNSVPLHNTHIPLTNNHLNISANADKPEPTLEPCDIDGIPDSWKDKPIRSVKKKKQNDPRYTHPAYVAYYRLTGRRPPNELIDYLIELVGAPVDENKLTLCRQEWLKRGYNPNAMTWVEWYKNGIPKQGGKVTNDVSILERFVNGQ